jgi:hypothetical protein
MERQVVTYFSPHTPQISGIIVSEAAIIKSFRLSKLPIWPEHPHNPTKVKRRQIKPRKLIPECIMKSFATLLEEVNFVFLQVQKG